MVTFKCKMCGGEMELEVGATVAECPYCLTKQTLPRLDNDKRANMYDRANHFRRLNEYDKAMTLFENILQEDRTDAEAYWSLVLCRYGIEYVEDPTTHKRVPTVNRVQYASIFTDEDYKSALEYADFEQRKVYELEAKAIDDIQKGILAISKQEKPFDVFICYKETDANGRRTPDSVLATDLYYQLTKEGFKVFFSRITLEDKIGIAYEPYIFAALNSSSVMVVLGTKAEYFNAVWVKNEWSRYLALIRTGAEKTLIPAYRDMDPYDLPDEFSHLQALDMSKLGFMQDLIHGIKKLVSYGNNKEQVANQQNNGIVPPGGTSIESLMKRARLFMEDGDFKSASEYLDRALDIDPEYASAYVLKTCVTFGLKKEDDLANLTFQYSDNLDWQKAIRFATPEQKSLYEKYYSQTEKRVTVQKRNYVYDCAIEMAVNPNAVQSELEREIVCYEKSCLSSNTPRADGNRRQNSQENEEKFSLAVQNNDPGDVSEIQYNTAASMFRMINDNEAEICAKQCAVLEKEAWRKAIYNKAFEMQKEARNNPSDLDKAGEVFNSILEYKDAEIQANQCFDKAESIRSIFYNAAVSSMNEAGLDSSKWKETQQKLARNELDGYRDVAELREKAVSCYNNSIEAETERRRNAAEKEKIAEAKAVSRRNRFIILCGTVIAIIFVAMLVITRFIIPENNYKKADDLRASGKYQEAIQIFEQLGEYKDAKDQIRATKYMEGIAAQDKKDWENAILAFEAADGYQDSEAHIQEIKNIRTDKLYKEANELYVAGEYEESYKLFTSIKGYKDVDDKLKDNCFARFVAEDEKKRSLFRNVGNSVLWGKYPQQFDGTIESVEWIVLDTKDHYSLLLSKYGLDTKPYDNSKSKTTTWEKCSLRNWLNHDFLNAAFSESEQFAIVETEIDNNAKQGYAEWNPVSQDNTTDMVFLLSYAEAVKYLSEENQNCAPTDYAIAQGAYTDLKSNWRETYTSFGRPAGWWWLRSPGTDQSCAMGYDYDPHPISYTHISSEHNCVRPSIWVDLDRLTFDD